MSLLSLLPTLADPREVGLNYNRTWARDVGLRRRSASGARADGRTDQPKSAIFNSPRMPSSRFSGLMSR